MAVPVPFGDQAHGVPVQDYLDIFQSVQAQLALTAAVANGTAVLPEGIYDLWCDEGRCFIKIDPGTVTDVTSDTGDALFRGVKQPYHVRKGHKIGAISAVTATLRYIRTG